MHIVGMCTYTRVDIRQYDCRVLRMDAFSRVTDVINGGNYKGWSKQWITEGLILVCIAIFSICAYCVLLLSYVCMSAVVAPSRMQDEV